MSSISGSKMDLSKAATDEKHGGRKNQNIQVFVRVRPMNAQELGKHAANVIDTPGNKEVVVKDRIVASLTKTFSFDRVFGPKSVQLDVYKTVVSPLLAEVLLGYNCTVFAYGQTGTGKTYTMEGDGIKVGVENDPSSGIIPRALSHLFEELRMMSCEFTVRASFLELYNEELFDLLAPIDASKTKTLRLFDDGIRKGSVIIQGLEEVIVQNKHEVYAVLEKGSQQRKTAATLMNVSSSRSHTIFTITVHMKESSVEGEEMVKVGKLNLVDLAGSENIAKSGAVEKRAREAGSINQSLLTLGRVISALVERTPHVPYRESKLTRLLQDSLGGKTKTSIIATISPAITNIEETLSTLDYAHRAKNIMNRPEVNQKLTKKEAFNYYTEEIERLRRDLNAAREKNGFFMDQENYGRMVNQIQSQVNELNEKSNHIKELEEYSTNRDEELREALSLVGDLQVDLQTKQTILDSLKSQKTKLEGKLSVYQRKNDELKHLVKYHRDTEDKMSGEASTLLDTANDTVSIIEQLHGRLERKQLVEQTNWKNAERFREDFRRAIDNIVDNVSDLKQHHTIGISNLRDLMHVRSGERQDSFEVYNSMFSAAVGKIDRIQSTLVDTCSKFIDVGKMHMEGGAALIEQKCESGAENLNSAMSGLELSVESLRKQFESVKTDLCKMQTELAVKFDAANKITMDSLNKDVQRFNATEEALIDLRDKWSSVVQTVCNKWKTFKSDQDKHRAYYKHQIELLKSGLKIIEDDALGNLERSDNAFDSMWNTLEGSSKELCTIMKNEATQIKDTRSSTEKVLKRNQDFRSDIVTNQQTWLEKVHDRLCTEERQFGEIKTRISKVTTDHQGTMDSVKEIIRGTSKATFDELERLHVTSSGMLNNQYKEIECLQQSSQTNVKKIIEGEANSIENLVSTLDLQCDLVSTRSTEVVAGLSHTAGAVDEFWEQTYLTDGPTGGTPMRRKFDYPTTLSAPSPHSRVIARYRSLRNDVQQAINECAEDSDLNSSRSTLVDEKRSMAGGDDSYLWDNSENQDPEKTEGTGSTENPQPSKENSTHTVTTECPPEPVAKEIVKDSPTDDEQRGSSSSKASTTSSVTSENSNNADEQVPSSARKHTNRPYKKYYNRSRRNSGGNNRGVLKPPN